MGRDNFRAICGARGPSSNESLRSEERREIDCNTSETFFEWWRIRDDDDDDDELSATCAWSPICPPTLGVPATDLRGFSATSQMQQNIRSGATGQGGHVESLQT